MKNELLEDIMSLEYNKRYRVWEPFMKKYDCQRVCEIGIRDGRHFKTFIAHKPEVAVAVDIWWDDGVMARNDLGSSQKVLDDQYETFVSDMSGNPFVQIHRSYSVDAAKLFPDEYFDVVYIDADHTYEGVMADIEAWYPKVKTGRLLIGDDYRRHKTKTGVRFGVIEAVERFTKENNLSYFVFPRSKWGLIK